MSLWNGTSASLSGRHELYERNYACNHDWRSRPCRDSLHLGRSKTGLSALRTEVGAEGNNGFDYQPGGVPAPQNNEHKGISDVTPSPEPASMALLGGGLAAMAVLARRRRRG